MKKLIVIALCLFGTIKDISAHRVVEVSQHGGLFGFYGHREQTLIGYFPNGDQWWFLECWGPGVLSCRLRPTAGKPPRAAEIEEVENAKLDNLMLTIQTDQIDNNVTSGHQLKHYQTTLSDNSVVDIYIDITWSVDPADPSKTLFRADISNSDD